MKSKTKIWLGVGAFVVAGVNGAAAGDAQTLDRTVSDIALTRALAPTDIAAQKRAAANTVGMAPGRPPPRRSRAAKVVKEARAARRAVRKAAQSFRRISISRCASRRCAAICWSATNW